MPATSCCWKLATASADGRLIEAANLQIDEAPLTGESQAVEKSSESLADTEPPPALADRRNIVYMGTTVTYGRGTQPSPGPVRRPSLGTIATLLQRVEKGRTPLQERLEKKGYLPRRGGAGGVCACLCRWRDARRRRARDAADRESAWRLRRFPKVFRR